MYTREVRAANSGVKITEHDAALIKGMGERGDRQADIAAYLGINQGRVNEILTGNNTKFRHVKAAALSDLPPPGPYVVVTRLEHEDARLSKAIAEEMLSRFDAVVAEMRARIEALSRGEVVNGR